MSLGTVLGLIFTGIIGLAIGIWLGMPGRYTQTPDDIERIMESGGARRRKTKRVFTPLAWMRRKVDTSVSRERRQKHGRSAFKIESPEDREA